MQRIMLDYNEEYSKDSKKQALTSGKTYEVITKVKGIKGKNNCAYFGIVLFGSNDKEIARKIQWLNDFSGSEQQYRIVFNVGSAVNSIRAVYRINKKTPAQADCEYELLELDKVAVNEVDLSTPETITTVRDYVVESRDELTELQENELERNLIWIFGSPRSGTTWLAKKLLSYNTFCIDEMYIGFHMGFFSGSPFALATKRAYEAHKDRNDYFFSDQFQRVWQKYMRKMVLNRIYVQAKRTDVKIVIKEPNSTIAADIMSQCLPNSKMIFILRDGRDCIDSLIDHAKVGPRNKIISDFSIPLHEYDRMIDIKAKAYSWLNLIRIFETAKGFHNPKLSFFIRYEDLRYNTLEILEQVYHFIGIEIPESTLEEIVEKSTYESIPDSEKGRDKAIRFAKPGIWKDEFSNEEQQLIMSIIGPKLKDLGYD